MKKIILASKSIDRREIFKRAGISFEIFSTDIDEDVYKRDTKDVIELVRELAKAKALFAKQKLMNNNLDAIIVAADTVVEFNGQIIGKAKNEEEAFQMLKLIMGRVHRLITGIAITETQKRKIIVEADTTLVEFLELSDEEIRDYVKTNEWKGRAGAYSIRDKASLFINKIHGSSSNVIGLPMQKLYLILRNEFQTNLFQINEN